MIGKTNAGGVVGIVNITSPAECTVTLTKTGYSMTFTKTGTSMSFKLPLAGTWHISATSGGLTEEKDITLTAGVPLVLTEMDTVAIYAAGHYIGGFASGWPDATEQESSIYLYSNNLATRRALSNGRVNLTGFNSIRVRISGVVAESNLGTGVVHFRIYDANGTELKECWGRGQDQGGATSFDDTWTTDVSNINQEVRFGVTTQFWVPDSGSGGYVNAYIHSIELLR